MKSLTLSSYIIQTLDEDLFKLGIDLQLPEFVLARRAVHIAMSKEMDSGIYRYNWLSEGSSAQYKSSCLHRHLTKVVNASACLRVLRVINRKVEKLTYYCYNHDILPDINELLLESLSLPELTYEYVTWSFDDALLRCLGIIEYTFCEVHEIVKNSSGGSHPTCGGSHG